MQFNWAELLYRIRCVEAMIGLGAELLLRHSSPPNDDAGLAWRRVGAANDKAGVAAWLCNELAAGRWPPARYLGLKGRPPN